MREYILVKEDYELIVELLNQHKRSIENAVESGDFVIEPTLAEFRDHAIRTRIGVEQILIAIEEQEIDG